VGSVALIINSHPVKGDSALYETEKKYPEFDIYREWWGILAVPAGTPVLISMFASGMDSRLARVEASKLVPDETNIPLITPDGTLPMERFPSI
jgi:hypothetical protein